MTIKEFLHRNNMKSAELSRWIGVNKSTVRRWMSGEVVPSPESIEMVSKVTLGKVRHRDWFPKKVKK